MGWLVQEYDNDDENEVDDGVCLWKLRERKCKAKSFDSSKIRRNRQAKNKQATAPFESIK